MCIALSLAWLLLLGSTSSTAAQSFDLAGYRQVITSSLSDLQNGTSSPEDVANGLEDITSVTMPDQSVIQPDLRVIVGYLNASPPRVSDAEASLSAMLAQLDRAGAAAMSVDQTNSATASLSAILARSEFQAKPQHQHQTVIGWIEHQFWRLLGPIFAPLGRIIAEWLWAVVPSTSIWVVVEIVVGLLAVGGAIFLLIRSIRRSFGPAVARMPAPLGSRSISVAELRAEAETLAGSGAYRRAIRALYLAALVRLDEQGILPFERSLTNREVLKSAVGRGNEGLAERLTPLVERFDQHWYGSRGCSEADYAAFSRLASWAWEAA